MEKNNYEFACKFCNEKYTDNWNLKKHVKKHHENQSCNTINDYFKK